MGKVKSHSASLHENVCLVCKGEAWRDTELECTGQVWRVRLCGRCKQYRAQGDVFDSPEHFAATLEKRVPKADLEFDVYELGPLGRNAPGVLARRRPSYKEPK